MKSAGWGLVGIGGTLLAVSRQAHVMEQEPRDVRLLLGLAVLFAVVGGILIASAFSFE